MKEHRAFKYRNETAIFIYIGGVFLTKLKTPFNLEIERNRLLKRLHNLHQIKNRLFPVI